MSDFILEFWNKQAKTHGVSHSASWGDNWAIDLEIDTIGKFIKKGDKVLDVGCANGYSALHHLDKNVSSIVGVDFSDTMIAQAQVNRAQSANPEKVSFEEGDIRKLRFESDSFDVVYTTRTVINLPNWEDQKQGLSECIRVCKPGGTIVFSEAFWEPLVLLNALRSVKQLPSLVEHDFNRYIKKTKMEEFLNAKKLKFENIDFSSIYYLGSRFVRELVTNPADYPGYSNPINRIFYEIEKEFSGGGFGIQQAYVVRK